MCFGLKNDSGSFERLIGIVLRDLQYEKCLVYIDDVIFKGHSFESAIENLREVLERFRQAVKMQTFKKCVF